MGKFVLEIAKFGGVQTVILITILTVFFGIPEKHHYLAATEDKAWRLRNIESPRLILIGDSGVAYGMRSDLIAEALPEYHVVNMAMMAGLGFRNIMAEVEPELRPGDVVVMIFAHQVFDRNLLHYQYWNYATYRPEMIARLNWRDIPTMMDNAPFVITRALHTYRRVMTWKAHPPREGPVNRAGFNQFGDLVAHHDAQPLPGVELTMVDLLLEDDDHARQVIREMNAFADSARAKGAQVFYMFPPIPEAAWEANAPIIRQAAGYAVDGLNFPILNSAKEMVYPNPEFYDTNYHLLGPGAKRRSLLLAKRLGALLGEEPARQP